VLDILRKIAYFLCITTDEPRLNLPDVAFIIILVKILMASSLDWQALVVFAVAILNSMHSRQTVATSDISEMTDKLTKLQTVVDTLKVKL
jgi:hypothetical protein